MKPGAAASLLSLAACLLIGAFDVQSKEAPKVARIGYLSTQSAAVDATNSAAFRDGLAALGYIVGKTAVIEVRHANGSEERLPELAAEIVRLKVDVIVAATTPAVRAVQAATTTIPVIMAFAGDPVGDRLVASLARPGGNTTGLSAAVTEIAAKRVEFLHAVVPRSSRFLLLAPPGASTSMVSATQQAAVRIGKTLTIVRVRNASDVSRAFSVVPGERFDGVIVDVAIREDIAHILELARTRQLPTISGPRDFARDGGLLAYGANYPDLFRRSAAYVDKILRGAKASELPIEQPTKFELVVNLRTADTLGLTMPPSLLTRADEVIH
jgi:putative ABC transport system substrate-binding protein